MAGLVDASYFSIAKAGAGGMATNFGNLQTDGDRVLDMTRIEFFDEARDCLEEIENALEQYETTVSEAAETLLSIREQCRGLKSAGDEIGLPTITRIVERFNAYLAETESMGANTVRDIEIYCQRLQDIVSSGIDPAPDDAAGIISGLPELRPTKAEAQAPRGKEVLLIMPSKTIGSIIERALNGHGCNVTRYSTALEAMPFVASASPDLVISAAVMDVMNGVGFASALASMETTAHIPVAVITSLNKTSSEFNNFPANVAIVQHGKNFNDDLARILEAS